MNDMDDTNLLMVCLNAFTAVMVLLSILALAMRLLTTLFPERKTASDAAVANAVKMAVQQMIPGASVVKMEEIKRGSP